MIKINYGSNSEIQQLKVDYLGIFSQLKSMRRKWRSIIVELKNIDATFGQKLPIKLDELLVMTYVDLVSIYEDYIQLNIPTDLTNKIKSLFSYDRITYRKKPYQAKQPLIAKFFMDRAERLDLYTCKYCDMAYINVYNISSGQSKNHFELDHMLDKGKCPLIGLSLFNFVPSCSVCNEKIKKVQTPGNGNVLRKLSPTSSLYDFENKVKIVITNKSGNCSTINYETRMDDFEIDFDCHLDSDYQHEVRMFRLKERYDFHKSEALRLMDLQERYSETHIIEIARLISGSDIIQNPSLNAITLISNIQADLFAVGFHEKHHRIFGKLYKDILD